MGKCIIREGSIIHGKSHPSIVARSAMRVVLWFRNDLRLLDNAVVDRAAALFRASSTACEVVPVYIIDPKFFAVSPRGMARWGAGRGKFTLESVKDLKTSLRKIGSDLLVRCGKTEQVLEEFLLEGSHSRTVFLTQMEVTSEERDIDKAVEQMARNHAKNHGGSAKLERIWGSTLYHLDDIPYNAAGGLKDFPNSATQYRKAVEASCQIRPTIPAPAANALGPVPSTIPGWDWMPSAQDLPFASPSITTACEEWIAQCESHRGSMNFDFQGGESAALSRLDYYLWQTDLIASYFESRNGMLGGDYSTKLAPWISLGCISPRLIAGEIKKYEMAKGNNKSTYWVVFELIFRDFFKFFALKHGNKIFQLNGTVKRDVPWKGGTDSARLVEAWTTGQTGYPLVDANMRELAATGFMSNRGRQNVASWLALDAGVDWRIGADWFEHHLLDYETTQNWGNWCAAAGMSGGRINHFNITKQTYDYDPQGEYIKYWCPELSLVPREYIADPHGAPKALREQIQLKYPQKVALPARAPSSYREKEQGMGRGNGKGKGGRRTY